MARRQMDWEACVNHRLPSGPFVISPLSIVNSVMVLGLPGVIRPSFPGMPVSVNQRLPSGPVTIANGRLFGEGMGDSVVGFGRPGAMRPVALPFASGHRVL